jgi:hypothetical protein
VHHIIARNGVLVCFLIVSKLFYIVMQYVISQGKKGVYGPRRYSERMLEVERVN